MQNSKNPTIGIIDSGIGGVAVLKKLVEKFKAGNFIYLADNLNMPYGKRTKFWLRKRVLYLIKLLKETYNVDYIIIACNTASTAIEAFDDKIVYKLSFDENATYLGTKLTKKNLPQKRVVADNTLATKIENNIFNEKALKSILKRHIDSYNLGQYKHLILACTHFELVTDLFKKFCPDSEILENSSFLLNKISFNMSKSELNIVILQTRQDASLEEKILKLIRS